MTSKAHGFWHGHNVPWVLTRWERMVRPDAGPRRDHPRPRPPGPARCGAASPRPSGCRPTASTRHGGAVANETLGTAQVALLRT